jgi:ATP-binding protein involved in chromosome partitioning
MPPGTGDIQITICQEVKLDGAVIVTTPQRLAFVDVIKGIQMFNDLQVRILGVVENMAYH